MTPRPPLDTEAFALAKDLFLQACRLSDAEQAAFLDEHCPNAAVRQEIESLLEHHEEDPEEESDLPLSSPAARYSSSSSSGSSDRLDDELEPGSMVGDRYRIVSPLGRGGMGQVYKADDLMLKETVALKFLRPLSAIDWLDEVRLARQVTHPNVCRVFDAGEVDGQAFISMEYVDGENLASLLNRIGRLPRNRLNYVAGQLFSGLAAAHAKGVLHRDLKPANIMIDGRGEVRITDFGIASSESAGEHGQIAGTPAYMAPEQHRLEEATTRTDLYSMGLVVYEMCTGVFPFEAESREEYAEAHQNVPAAPPTSLVEDIDPTLERVILKCLEKEASDRPSSALAVAAALPGGDPLSLAVSIGETPSPEMVAEAGSRGVMNNRTAGVLGGVACLLLLAVLLLADPAKRLDVAGLELPPEVLAEKAREKLRAFGWTDRPADEASGFLQNDSPLRTVSPDEAGPPDPSAPGASSILFWYRQSPYPMMPSGLHNLTSWWGGAISPYDPPLESGAMALVLLHPSGTLDHLEVRPRFRRPEASGQEGEGGHPGQTPKLDAERVLRAAGLEPDRLAAQDGNFPPPFFADARAAFRGTTELRPDLELDVRVAAFGGRPVYFRMVPVPSEEADPESSWVLNLVHEWQEWWDLILLIAVLAAIPLVRRNLRRGRGDRRSARRLASFAFVSIFGLWLIRGPHLPYVGSQVAMIRLTVGRALVAAAQVWLFYLALEPYVRRLWPHSLIAWTRLLAGRYRDPLVARSVLIGVIFGAGWALMDQIDRLLPGWLGLPYHPNPILGRPFDYAVSGRASLAGIGEELFAAVYDSVFSLLLLLLLRLLVRRPWWAMVAYVALTTTLYAQDGVHPVLSWFTVGLATSVTEVVVLVRFGLVTYAAAAFVVNLLSFFPITLDFTAWYADTGFLALGVIALLVAAAVSQSVASRRPKDRTTERFST